MMPRYNGNAIIPTRYTEIFINSVGINLITVGISTKKCRMRKKENKKDKVIRPRSQQKIIHRGANLFVKYFFIIKGGWRLNIILILNPADIKSMC